jgi:S-adenosylmethionine:tRNA ribosyltransferase-isomerase
MSDLDHYDYELPPELIAQHPLSCRTDARMMVVDRKQGTLEHAHVRDFPSFLQAGDGLMLNDTRVLPARLVGYRTATKGRWTGLFLRADGSGIWEVMCKTRGKLQPGESITLQDSQRNDGLHLKMLVDLGDGRWAVAVESDQPAPEILSLVGHVPLPPYIRGGEMQENDVDRYQTVFAEQPGAIAAPTAGLHFTEKLLADVESRDASIHRLTLHVGVGTFRPITSDRLDAHQMHSEWGEITSSTASQVNHLRATGGRLVAVGTTCVRLLETASQDGLVQPWRGTTDLFIRPPYTFQAVDAMLTNFHLPRSTLVVLVRTFGGDQLIQRAYAAAIEEGYRFYSYGDAMLIL